MYFEQKLPRCIIPQAMFKFGGITIVAASGTNSDISVYTIFPLFFHLMAALMLMGGRSSWRRKTTYKLEA